LKSKGEIKMIKIKRFVIILMVFALSAALLTGFVMGQENSVTTSNATASGTLKAVDIQAGIVTITPTSGDELALKLTADSKIQIGGSPSDLTQLAAKIGAKVDVEYQVEAKTVTVISIKE
jgi:hypothetical protein